MDIRNSINAISALAITIVVLLPVQLFIPNSCVAQQYLSSENIPTTPVERKFVYRYHKPPTVKHGIFVTHITGIGRSEGGLFDGSRFVVYISCGGVPNGFSFNEHSIEAVDSLGNKLNPWAYTESHGNAYPFEVELGFELPAKPFSELREFKGSFDNSYITQRKYGPYAMKDLKKSLVFKDRRGAISFSDWQVMNIPYDMIADSAFRFTGAGGTESLYKKLPDEQHGYFVFRCYAMEKGVMDNIAATKFSVYGSDGRWHDAIAQENDINSSCSDFTSVSAYLGFSVGSDQFLSGKEPAKVVSVGGPGKKAGIEVGDIVTKLGSMNVSNLDDIIDVMFRGVHPGIPVSITVLRNGKKIELEVVPSEYPIWSGMSVDAGIKTAQKLGRLVRAGRDWRICALAFVLPDPVSLNFRPIKLKLVHGEKVKATKTISFKFHSIPLPANFWSAKMKVYN